MNAISINEDTKLHCGSTSDLHRITHEHDIVIKILRKEYINNDLITKRFAKEKSLLQKLTFNHVPKIVPVNIHSDALFFAYEYIHGIRLNEITCKNNINHDDVINLTRQLLSLLSEFSEVGLIHSDISPDNIILDKQGALHLIDFGSADQPLNNTLSTSTWIAKYAYCSPEQAQGRTWTLQSDLYQVGLILYEMLCKKRFNAGLGRNALAMAASPLELSLETIPQKYHSLLKALLEPEPEKRCLHPSAALMLLNII